MSNWWEYEATQQLGVPWLMAELPGISNAWQKKTTGHRCRDELREKELGFLAKKYVHLIGHCRCRQRSFQHLFLFVKTKASHFKMGRWKESARGWEEGNYPVAPPMFKPCEVWRVCLQLSPRLQAMPGTPKRRQEELSCIMAKRHACQPEPAHTKVMSMSPAKFCLKELCVKVVWKSCVWQCCMSKSSVWKSCVWKSGVWKLCERVVSERVTCDNVVCERVVCDKEERRGGEAEAAEEEERPGAEQKNKKPTQWGGEKRLGKRPSVVAPLLKHDSSQSAWEDVQLAAVWVVYVQPGLQLSPQIVATTQGVFCAWLAASVEVGASGTRLDTLLGYLMGVWWVCRFW